MTSRVADLLGADPYPGSTPQAEEDHKEPGNALSDLALSLEQPTAKEYQWIWANGQLHVSPIHDHGQLSDSAGVGANHTGPFAAGYVSVVGNRATWSAESNIALRGLARVLEDYGKAVGWEWDGLNGGDGQPIADDLGARKSMWYREAGSDEVSLAMAHFPGSKHIDIRGKTAYVDRAVPGLVEWAKDFGYTLHAQEHDHGRHLAQVVYVDQPVPQEDPSGFERPYHGTKRVPFLYHRPSETVYIGKPGGYHHTMRLPNEAASVKDEMFPGGLWPEHPKAELYDGNLEPEHLTDLEVALNAPVEVGSWHSREDPWNFAAKTAEYPGLGVKEPGQQAFFEYHCNQSHESPDAQAWYRSHQPVKILSREPFEDEGGPRHGYMVEFDDGHIHQAFDDELHDSPEQYGTQASGYDNWGPPEDWRERIARTAEYPGGGNAMDKMKTWEHLDGFDKGNPEAEPRPSEMGEIEGPVKCPDCGETFHNFMELQLHARDHEGPRPEEIEDGHFPWPEDKDAPLPYRNRNVNPTANPVMGSWHIAAEEPKDMLQAPVPFVYDVLKDHITTGHPGMKTSDVMGQFTPEGIVEGYYEPGGKLKITTTTNMPYSIFHMQQLWYYMHPTMELTGLELETGNGETKKIAASGYHQQMWHGSSKGPLGPIRPGFFATTHRPEAEGYAGMNLDLEQEGQVHPVTLNFKNPLHSRWMLKEEAIAKAERAGHDGVVLHFPEDNSDPSNPLPERQWAYVLDPSAVSLGHNSAHHHVANNSVGSYLKTLAASEPAAWNSFQALRKAGGKVYVVGGAVRDALLQKEPKDIDLMVSGIPSEEVNHILSNLPGRVDLTGKRFGVYRYRTKGNEVEIALPREDSYEGAEKRSEGKIRVDHNLPVEEDLKRRDFTANSMAVDLDDGRLIDPYGGAKDIEAHVLRTTHPSSFSEDPTRLVRALVASSRHGLVPDEQTRAEMKDNASSLDNESPDALKQQLDKLLESPNPTGAIRLAQETGVLHHLFPELAHNFDYDQNNPHHRFTLGEHSLNVLNNVSRVSADPDVRLAALLHDVGKPASAWIDPQSGVSHYYQGFVDGQPVGADHARVGSELAEARLRKGFNYPTAKLQRVRSLIDGHMFSAFSSGKGARKFLNKYGENADDLLTLREGDLAGKGLGAEGDEANQQVEGMRNLVGEVRTQGQATDMASLAINGNDLIALGIPAGPQIGSVLRYLTEQVVDNPQLNNPTDLTNMARNYVNNPTA